ncbi:MAG: hypothetical protein ACI93H_000622 [Psychromonas sp.]
MTPFNFLVGFFILEIFSFVTQNFIFSTGG